MKSNAGIRVMALVLAALFALPLFSPAARADDYDERYPEILDEGHLTASSAILIEGDSGKVIYEKNADQPAYPASTTKILTVWLALTLAERLEGASMAAKLDTRIPVSQEAVNIAPDESSARLAAGEEVALIDLCYAAMLPSGNDAANAIAEGLAGGSRDYYVDLMNSAASSLGCTGTHFVNPNGLHDENHFTTARDMAILSRVAMQNEYFRQIVGADSHVMPRDNVYRSRTIANRNNFVTQAEGSKADRYYSGSTGIKTGTTSAAGNCLVASATRDGINLIAVVFNATTDTNRYVDARRLMDYGFSQFISVSVGELYAQNPRVVDIRGFDLADEQVGRLTLKLKKDSAASTGKDLLVMTRDEQAYWAQNFSSMTVTEFTREFRAPIQEGEVMGTLTYYGEDGNPVVYNMLASRSIAARAQLAPSIEQIIAAAENDPNPFPRLTFELVFLYGIVPAVSIYLLVRFSRAALRWIKSKRKMKAIKPTGRYYR